MAMPESTLPSYLSPELYSQRTLSYALDPLHTCLKDGTQPNGADEALIIKVGRWSSNTFLTYIHEQIGALSAGLSLRVSTRISFQNVAR